MSVPAGPSVIGLKRSFGFGDRLGLATPGHISALGGHGFAPYFAQQSIREMSRTGRTPEEVMRDAAQAIEKERWAGEWGSDADHLQTREDVFRTAAAGFTMFTIDPSVHVVNRAAEMGPEELERAAASVAESSGTPLEDVLGLYLGKAHEIGDGEVLTFKERTDLIRGFVKYYGALVFARQMHGWIAEACAGRPFEVELSVDETLVPTSPLEHLFVGLELKRLGVGIVSLAPRFIGDFEKGIDYKGDLKVFESHYRRHALIASYCGPYKLSIHSGSDKFSIYPIAGRLSGELLHVKTAGTSYLEALRVVCRAAPGLFAEIAAFCRGRYEKDRASYHVSASLSGIPERIEAKDMEKHYLDTDCGRQIMHVTFGSVLLQGKDSKGASFRELLLDCLRRQDSLYREVLQKHLGRHLRCLSQG